MKLSSLLRFGVWIATALVVGSPAFAETTYGGDVTIEDIRAEDESIAPRWAALWRGRLSYPQTVSGSVGVIRARLPESWECVATCPYRGWTFQVEPGLHGVQVSAGYATLMAELRHNKRFLADVYLGFGVKGVVLRTWGDANLTPSNQTLAGTEFAFTVVRFNFSLAALHTVGGNAEGDWVLSGGMGWGF